MKWSKTLTFLTAIETALGSVLTTDHSDLVKSTAVICMTLLGSVWIVCQKSEDKVLKPLQLAQQTDSIRTFIEEAVAKEVGGKG